jgi:choline-sulfatase
MITDGRYKLMRYAEGGDEEFYDLQLDPFEMRNLTANDPIGGMPDGAEAAIERLRGALASHLEQSGDSFEALEAYAPARWRSHAPGYHNHTGIAAPQSGEAPPGVTPAW